MMVALEDSIAEVWFKGIEESTPTVKNREFVVVEDPAKSMATASTAGVVESDGNADCG